MTSFTTLIPETVSAQARDGVGRRLLAEYGSVFVARGGAVPPDQLIFRDQVEVERFQKSISIDAVKFGEINIELQSVASDALRKAVREAEQRGLSITPRSVDSGRRSYSDTVELWKSRVEPALDHWVEQGRLSREHAERIRSILPFEQVPEVLKLEETGVFFAKDLSKTILYSVAPPGASQHLSMLAFDVAEFNDTQIRQILERNYWYQTVPSDLPHFTFLGVQRAELPGLGLKCVVDSERDFWVPDT